MITRRHAIKTLALAAGGLAAATSKGADSKSMARWLTQINPEFMISPDEAFDWAVFKSGLGPTYSGSPAHIKYTNYLISTMQEFGVVDIDTVQVPYLRYVVNDWPDPRTHVYGSGVEIEKLVSDGTPVPVVASYGMTSGFTPTEGVTAQMVYYDPANPPPNAAIAAKILVFQTAPQPSPPFTTAFEDSYTFTDYEYRSPGKWFPPFEYVPPSVSTSFNSRWVWSQLNGFAVIGMTGNAAGIVLVYDLSPGAAFGLLQRSVYTATGAAGPGIPYINCPTLALDRVNGAKVLADAKAGKTATLTLIASFEQSTGKAIVAYLPGKNYGTPQDEQLMLATHTDAMSLVEEVGGFAMLSIMYYFNHIPQSERPRTLTFFFDCRHFMPGAETSWSQYDYYVIHPELLKPIVAGLGMEHHGGRQTIEVGPGGNDYEFSKEAPEDGGVITSLIDLYNNNLWFIELIERASKDNKWVRVFATAGNVEPGVNGGFQGMVKSPMNKGRTYGFPGIGLAGDWPGAWTQSYSQVNTEAGFPGFDKYYFVSQVAGFCQMAGEMMLVQPIVIDLGWGELKSALVTLPDSNFVDPSSANVRRGQLVDTYVAVFRDVERGAYDLAKGNLETALKNRIQSWLVPASQAALLTLIDGQIAKLPPDLT